MEVEQEKNHHEPVLKTDNDRWVYGSCVDYNGRIPLRTSTGSWKAALFIVGIEFSERLSYFGISTALIIYLTKVLHQDIQTAAKSVNYWIGVTTMMPLIGGFIADSYLGCFFTVLASSMIYIMGLLLLTMSRAIPSLKPGDNHSIHGIVFFVAIYMISMGTGGHKPALESFGADQFDEHHAQERKQRMSFFNWWNFAISCGCLLGVTIIVYIQDNVGWLSADIVLTSVMASSLTVFMIGRRFFRYRKPMGSPLVPFFQVVAAAVAKRKLHHPPSPEQLYEVSKSEMARGERLLSHTHKLKFLDKAAILEEEEEKQHPWRLATVTKVEEMKLIINMIPIWVTALPFGISIAQTSTFFIKQSTTMNRRITEDFLIPPASIYALTAVGLIITITVYDTLIVPCLRKLTGNERGIKILHRIGIGMAFSVVAMVVAALIEKKRLNSRTQLGVFWLAPQFVITGIGDAFAIVGLQEYFYDQVPDSMRSLGIAFYLSVIGAANFLSSLLITVVDHVTDKMGNNWFDRDLDSSHLDRFYWLLAVIGATNICVYAAVSRRYSYKNVTVARHNSQC